jgi:1,4-alpha-glucan branching enzyme
MGEEWGASTPFLYFCDFGAELAALVREGRRAEFARFPEFQDPALRERIPDPGAATTVERSRLDWSERAREPHATWLATYRELLRLRREHVVPRLAAGVERATARRPSANELRVDWRFRDGGTATLLVNVDARPATFEAPPGTLVWPATPGEPQAVVQPSAVHWYYGAPA